MDEENIRQRYQVLAKSLDERMRRLFAGAEALAIGRGGQAAVARATGLSRGTAGRGMREVQEPGQGAAKGRVRRPGGGRKRTVVTDPSLREDLDRLVEPASRGDPLISPEVVVNLIGATTTAKGLRVQSALDANVYPAGRTVTGSEFDSLYLRRDAFHGEWNYALIPRLQLTPSP